MANPIFHSAYTAQQIEDEITNGVPKVVNGYWYRWDIATSAWVNTGIGAGVEPPYVVTLAADMTDTGLTYIYIGSEAGYTFGHWYYWDGVQWADGGAFLAAPADSKLSFTSTNAVQNKVIAPVALNAYPTATVEGAAMASFTDGADEIPPKTLIVNIDPVQAAGTPSPADPLPITGWTAANIVVSPTQDAGDGTTYTVNWQDSAGTVYGGTLADNGDGTWTLNVEKVSAIVDGNNLGIVNFDDNMDTSNAVACYVTFSDFARFDNYSGKLFCDKMPVLSIPVAKGGSPFTEYKALIDAMDCSVAGYRRANQTGSNNYVYFSFNKTNYPAFAGKDVEDANAWFAANPVRVVYELATPISYTLTAESIRTLLGDNNIFADTGDIAELTYRADPTLYINGKINAIMATIANL